MSRLLLGKEPLSMVRDSRDHLRLVITKPGGGGGNCHIWAIQVCAL